VRIRTAYLGGADSSHWPELKSLLPHETFKFFASRVGYRESEIQSPLNGRANGKATWSDLREIFETEMKESVENKKNGATKKVLAPRTEKRYRQTLNQFEAFLGDRKTYLENIKPATIELFKASRRKQIESLLKQCSAGGGIALDVAILHRVFRFAIDKGLMQHKPISLENESKPGKNPKNGARAFNADELKQLRDAAKGDILAFLLLRWSGLRGGDAINLRWENVRFDQGINGEIEVLTQKRSKIAIIPLSTELRNALESTLSQRKKESKGKSSDYVLVNPETNHAYANGDPYSDAGRKRLYTRMVALGKRANVRHVTTHCFRDTFACDMLARGMAIYDVAKMLADTVDTIEKHYAQFVPAARDAAQSRMDRGIGIEEQAKISQARNQKIVAFPGA
jgi:integrase